MKAVFLSLVITTILVYMISLAKCNEKSDDIFDFNLMDFDLSPENNKTRNTTKPTQKPVSDNIEIMEMSDDISGSARKSESILSDIADESDEQRNKSGSTQQEMSWLDTLRLMSQKCADNDTRVVSHIAHAELIAEQMSKLEEALGQTTNKSLAEENRLNQNDQKRNNSSVRPSQQLSNG